MTRWWRKSLDILNVLLCYVLHGLWCIFIIKRWKRITIKSTFKINIFTENSAVWIIFDSDELSIMREFMNESLNNVNVIIFRIFPWMIQIFIIKTYGEAFLWMKLVRFGCFFLFILSRNEKNIAWNFSGSMGGGENITIYLYHAVKEEVITANSMLKRTPNSQWIKRNNQQQKISNSQFPPIFVRAPTNERTKKKMTRKR